MGDYVDRVLREADEYPRGEVGVIDTLYFGGGTPSTLPSELFSKLFRGIYERFDFAPDAEITVEVNPGTLTKEWVDNAKSLGVNRISIGLQSIHKNELKWLGRIHSFEDFLSSYSLLRDAGFDNISVDLMYGIPEQTMESFEATLKKIIELSPEHISAYGLIIEEGTPFFATRDTLPLPDEDTECDMYYLADDLLSQAGYGHYEISNYARKGRESRHNLKYWTDKEFIGLGAAAYSYYGGKRYGNVRSLEEYLASKLTRIDVTPIDREDEMFEYAMMRLRLLEGICLSDYALRFGSSFLDGREDRIEKYIALGYMKNDGDRLSLTPKGFYISNSILSDIL